MLKKNINLIGSSLYSIFLALELSKSKKYNIAIYEKSKNFLHSFSSIKIGKKNCNPGFHAFESIRSDKLLKSLKNNFNINLKEKKKSRGIIIDEFVIDSKESYKNWPKNIINKYNLKNKEIKIKPQLILKRIDQKYIKFIHNNLGNNFEIENTIQLIYPWFFPNNYTVDSRDEGSKHLNNVRKNKIKHSYYVPKKGLFQEIKNPILKKLKKEGIKIYLNKNISLIKEKNFSVFCDEKKLDGKSIITLPVFTILNSIKNNRFKLPKIIPHKYYTALIRLSDKNILDNYLEVIVSSEKLKGLRRISNYSFIKKDKNYIYQIEFIEDKNYKNIDLQIKSYVEGLRSIIKMNKNNKKINIKFKIIGFKFLRYIFSPKNRILNDLVTKFDRLFKNEKNIIIPRYITWPINTNKQYLFSKIDINSIEKKI